jgi:hypothetical protein
LGKRIAVRVCAGAFVALAASCGGGGGGGNPVEPPTASLVFTPAQNQTANSLALVRSNGTDPNSLALDLRGTGVSDLYGVAFDLAYPASLRYDGATEGTWLNGGGAAQTSLQVATGTNRLTVGITRLGALSGITGDGTLLTLRFSAVAAGSGSIEFVAPNAYSTTSNAYTVRWIGGSVAVTR